MSHQTAQAVFLFGEAMAFRTDTPLQDAFREARIRAKRLKQYMQEIQSDLSSNITAVDALGIVKECKDALTVLSASAAVPGIIQYAKDQYNDTNYAIGTEFTTMTSTIQAVVDWIVNNIPAGSVSISNGDLVGNSYTPAQTAPLLTLVNGVIAAIA